MVFFFAALAEVQVTVLSVLNLPRQGLPLVQLGTVVFAARCYLPQKYFAIRQRTIKRGWIKWAKVAGRVAWKPKVHDDVMLNGVFRICLWLVARQLRIPNRQKDLWPKRNRSSLAILEWSTRCVRDKIINSLRSRPNGRSLRENKYREIWGDGINSSENESHSGIMWVALKLRVYKLVDW